MKTSCSFLILLVSTAFVYDATLAGLFSTKKRKAPSNCLKPPYLGKCNRTIHAWYFDPTKGWCKMFTYGPCGGGANNFRYELECLRHCRQKRHPRLLCSLPPKTRPCWGSSRQWYFDTSSNTCRMFEGKMCAENANGFSSCRKCLYRCSSKKAGDACIRSTLQGQTSVWAPPLQSQATGIRNQLPSLPPYSGHPEAQTGWQGSTYPPQIGTGNGIPDYQPHQGLPPPTGGWHGNLYPSPIGTNRKPAMPPYQAPYPTSGRWQRPASPYGRTVNGTQTWPTDQGPFSTSGTWNGSHSPHNQRISGPSTWSNERGARSEIHSRQPSQPYPPSSPVSHIIPVSPSDKNGKNQVFNTSMYAALKPL
ncbi:uncharacterized protein LOC142765045 [Rhipicephalus microplus]|uniref:uncharacterized protein LOC142765045 n=1 Tax=Rhipicephalus microplus TaxID=6941 RepID=UPI003F6B2548